MATEKGVKLDTGKPRMELLPLEALESIAEVMTFGANKYCDNGWKTVPNGLDRYKGALLRHLVAIEKGETVDPESGLDHYAHVACNALFMLYLRKANA